MIRDDRLPRILLRAIAIAIALLGLLDPTITTNRAGKPLVSIVGHDSARVASVARAIDKRFMVIRGIVPAADASVIVGDALPTDDASNGLARPVFAVLDDTSAARASIEDMSVPEWVPRMARVPARVTVVTRRARGRLLDVAIASGGLIVARATHTISTDDERVPISLGFVPSTLGATPLRISAALEGARDSSITDAVVDVRDARWNVLFFDARPSWMSTFVRRSLEQDARFTTTSRVLTSRGVSTQIGRAPARLDDLVSVSRYDAIVVGAPDALTARDVSGLDRYLRRRGGGVLLLLDRRVAGPYDALTRVTRWATDSGKAMTIASASDSIHAAEVTWPVGIEETVPIATMRSGDTTAAVVWSTNVGAGQLVVSGALDAWRFRDRGASDTNVPSFDRFWRGVIAGVANDALPEIDVRAQRSVLRPGERTAVEVTLRDATLSSTSIVHASARAMISGRRTDESIRLLPAVTPGTLVAEVDAPTTPGTYYVTIASGNARAEAPIIVKSDASSIDANHADLVAAFARAHGGRAFEAGTANLSDRLASAIHPVAKAVAWHPMRSAWWILAFALALSAEWWLRRRRNLR